VRGILKKAKNLESVLGGKGERLAYRQKLSKKNDPHKQNRKMVRGSTLGKKTDAGRSFLWSSKKKTTQGVQVDW